MWSIGIGLIMGSGSLLRCAVLLEKDSKSTKIAQAI